jgi:hypothetical protein
MFGNNEDDRNFVQQLEETISPLMETCKICGNKLKTTDALQDHIVAVHCTQPAAIIQLMEQHRVMLGNILSTQEAHSRQLTCSVLHHQD